MSQTTPHQPSFGLSRYRTHKRAQSENRNSTTWSAGFYHMSKLQSDSRPGMVRDQQMKPNLSVKTTPDNTAHISESSSIPRSATAAIFHRHSHSSSSSASTGNPPSSVPFDISKKAANMLGVQDSPRLSLNLPWLEPDRKRPPKHFMEPYSEGYYGLARLSMSMSDTCLTLSDDDDGDVDANGDGDVDGHGDREMHENTEDVPQRKSLDDISEDVGEDIEKLIRETSIAFDAVGASFSPGLLGTPEISARTGLRPSPGPTPNASPALSTQSSRDGIFSKGRRTSHFQLNSPKKEADSRSLGPFQASKTSTKNSTDTKAPSPSNHTTNSEPTDAAERAAQRDADSEDNSKPQLKSHWSESSTDSVKSVGVAHAVTAPLPPMRPGQQLVSPTAARNRMGQTNKRGRGHSRSNRWGLSEGVHDILTGQRFKKPEVEELLTPDRLAQLKRSREQASRAIKLRPSPEARRPQSAKEASDNISGDASEPDTMNTSQRVSPKPEEEALCDEENAKKNEEEEEKKGKEEEVRKGETEGGEEDAEVKQGTGQEMKKLRSKSSSKEEFDVADIGYTSDMDSSSEDDIDSNSNGTSASSGFSVPSPPLKNPARYKELHEKAAAPLPPIPNEAQAKALSSGEEGEEDGDNIYLRSTPFTLTNPFFKHGLITFSKAEIGRAALTMDDAMDWTAFQMAILGGAGELYDEKVLDDDDQFCEDVSEWFDTINTDVGSLIKEEEVPSAPGSARSSLSSRSSSLASEDGCRPIPLKSEFRVKPDEHDGEVRFYQGGKFRPWDANNLPEVKPLNIGRQTQTSNQDYKMAESDSMSLKLSRTAMEPVVANGDSENEDSAEHLNMGFNLNQDLGEYLQWEQAHMTGNGF